MLQSQPAPSELYVNLVTNFRLARAIWCAAHFRLADAIGTGPTSVDDIAATTGTNAGALRRLLDALTASGLICSDSAGHYGLTPASAVLRSDHPQSQRALIDLTLGGEFYEAWGALQSTLVTGQTAFEARHGASWIDFYNAHPESGRAFAEAMTGVTRAFEAGVLQSDPFPPFRRVVDVGGSQGSLLRSLLEHTPDATGVVLDLPNVIAGWSESGVDTLGGRITGVGGNFFESVPAGEDLYLLKMILHDWDDERAVSILRTVGEAMGPSSRLAIVEVVLPDSPTPHWGWMMDINMMVLTGGQERTEREFRRLLERADLELDRVIPTASPLSVLLVSRPHPVAPRHGAPTHLQPADGVE